MEGVELRRSSANGVRRRLEAASCGNFRSFNIQRGRSPAAYSLLAGGRHRGCEALGNGWSATSTGRTVEGVEQPDATRPSFSAGTSLRDADHRDAGTMLLQIF